MPLPDCRDSNNDVNPETHLKTNPATGSETGSETVRASLRQIAAQAGVSTQTVSNVLNNRAGRVSEETRKRVLCAVRELNYIPISRPAMQNRHVETRAIGIVFLDEMKFLENLNDRLGLITLAGMRARARQYEYDLLLLFRPHPEGRGPGPEKQYLDRRYDGVIFIGQCPRSLAETLVKYGLPTVVCYSTDTPPGAASVIGDNPRAMRMAVQHLRDAGHTRIAHLAGPRWSMEANIRRDAYREAMQDAQLQECIVQGETWGEDLAASRALAENILQTDATGIVSANDGLALDLWQVAEERGLQIPRDLSLVGMDNMDQAAARGLTSIVNPFHQIGVQSIDSMLHLIKGGDYRDATRRLPVDFIQRHSVGPPPAASSRTCHADSART